MNIQYVYTHTNPNTGEIFYVGRGQKGRAWSCEGGKNRSVEHYTYMFNLMLDGFIPTDWVEIVGRNLTIDEATVLEQQLVKTLRPILNKDIEIKRVTEEIKKNIKELKDSGDTIAEISRKVGFDPATVRYHL